jgi:hypothetical protein
MVDAGGNLFVLSIDSIEGRERTAYCRNGTWTIFSPEIY